MSENDGFFSKFSGKTGFFVGMTSAIMVFFAIGFIVLLAITLKNSGQNGRDLAAVDNTAGGVAGAAQPTQP
ncbi:MAG: hypothetical protein Q8L21_01795, partial [Candidatus Komeilibacteria bacterium]|nr:hypothetical protein [Candidatus Komeilibacteria bacterium]